MVLDFFIAFLGGTAVLVGIRSEIVKWANPILGAVRDVRSRLGNILDDKAYPALQKEPRTPIPEGWSIEYDYCMPSTLYRFCRYFYGVKRFQGALSFELFRSQAEMDALPQRLQAVRQMLRRGDTLRRCGICYCLSAARRQR